MRGDRGGRGGGGGEEESSACAPTEDVMRVISSTGLQAAHAARSLRKRNDGYGLCAAIQVGRSWLILRGRGGRKQV